MKNTIKTNYNSSFWMGDWDDDIYDSNQSKLELKSDTLYKLASYKRAIGNFVSIVTGEQIPVRFQSNGDSYTDGKSVTISSKLDNLKEFDVAVGLALHEGSHIKLSDFELLRDIRYEIPKLIQSDIKDKAYSLGIDYVYTIKTILNYVEDRRIDQYIFSSAPGYRDYYRAMYDKYFNDSIVDKGLNSEEYTDETLDSYMFRLINLHSEHSHLSVLKNLRKIYEVIDLANISRLKSSKDAFYIACSVFELIIEALDESKSEENESGESSQSENSESTESQSGEGSQSDKSEENSESNESNSDGQSDENDENENSDGLGMDMGGMGNSKKSNQSSEPTKPTEILTDKQKEQLRKKIKTQENFINGEVAKKKLTKSDLQTIKVMDESKTEMQVVGDSVIKGGVQCIVVRNLTQSLMENDQFPYTYMNTYSNGLYDYNSKYVSEGIRMGTILGKKLQTRAESRETVFNRQRNGRLDKRMVSSLGFGNEQVFYTREVDKYKKANLHISIDASGSMSGNKWNKTITTVVALAKAVDMIPNLEIQISLRSTSTNDLPYIVIAYDSRVDKFTKVKSVFPYLTPSGITPEGLTFEAIQKEMVPQSTEMDSYFLNFSDGEPYYSTVGMSYYGDGAARHTYNQVKRMKMNGIDVLSYFIDSSGYGNSSDIFKQSYGDSASFVDVSNVSSVIKTMNSLFMKKS
jgi:hypothetical protein